MTNSVLLHPSWSADEQATAISLYEQGVPAGDVADTLNQLYGNGRTTVAVRRHMHDLRIVWGCRVDDEEHAALFRRSLSRGRQGARTRTENVAAAQRQRPWHPLHDPRPDWLQR